MATQNYPTGLPFQDFLYSLTVRTRSNVQPHTATRSQRIGPERPRGTCPYLWDARLARIQHRFVAVGETENKTLSRMTFVVVGDDRVLEQVRKQLEKIVTVVRVIDVSSRDFVERDLLLVKVQAPSGPDRAEIRELVDIFRGRIVDVGPMN